MNAKLAILSLALCLAALSQSLDSSHRTDTGTTKAALSTGYAPHPSGTKLIVRHGTNEIVRTRRQCKSRMHQILQQIRGLQEQLEIGRRYVRDYPPKISELVAEMEENRMHISIMDSMGVGDEPAPSVTPPPSPPGMTPLPTHQGSGSGLPASLIVR